MPSSSGRLLLVGGLLAALIGVGVGIGGYTFVYAEGGAYMTDRPEACANCHVMREQYDAWRKSSHHHVAVCNDCHTPKGFFAKYYTKAKNGWHHSYAFTSGDFHEPIDITPGNRAITEQRCRDCHADMAAAIAQPCIRCHDAVGHANRD